MDSPFLYPIHGISYHYLTAAFWSVDCLHHCAVEYGRLIRMESWCFSCWSRSGWRLCPLSHFRIRLSLIGHFTEHCWRSCLWIHPYRHSEVFGCHSRSRDAPWALVFALFLAWSLSLSFSYLILLVAPWLAWDRWFCLNCLLPWTRIACLGCCSLWNPCHVVNWLLLSRSERSVFAMLIFQASLELYLFELQCYRKRPAEALLPWPNQANWFSCCWLWAE